MDSYLLSNYGAFPLVTEVTPRDVYHLWLTPTLKNFEVIVIFFFILFFVQDIICIEILREKL